MKAGRLLCCKSEMLRVSAGLLSRAAASQVLRSSGLRGCFVGARQEVNSPPALLCPPQAPLRADPLLSCGPRNRQRTAAGQRAGSAPEQGMWLAGATSFRRALGPWGPGERARRRRRRARRRRRSARSAALSGHLRSQNGQRKMRDYYLCQRSDCLLRAAVKRRAAAPGQAPQGRRQTPSRSR